MTTNHVDQLAQWWENAEEGIPSAGDTVIFDERHRGLGFHVTQATKDHPRGYDNARILARAPKPKPAWHDAVAVMADTPGRPERRVFIRDVEQGWWSDADSSYETDELAHVTPLIEAKVTDAMVKRARAQSMKWEFGGISENAARAMLTAALGLETA